MKRNILLLTAALLGAALTLPRTADAQVEKQVEVTKDYIPRVQQAAKLAVAPDMTDTTRMRPEIGYSITPLSLNTAVEMQPIRPATVNYWSFNRPLPFYLKVGAGYPLNSVLDFYAATQHPDTGYALAYINHEGRYAKLRNNFDELNNSMRMLNRIGGAAGKYFGRHILEGTIAYENRLYHRSGAYAVPALREELSAAPGARIDFGSADLAIRFGDDFEDLSRWNFDVTAAGNLFYDQSRWAGLDDRPRQTTLRFDGKVARAFGKHRLALLAGYSWTGGRRGLAGLREQLIHAGVRYGSEGRWIDFEAGLDYFHDRIAGRDASNYIFPFLRMDFNLGTAAIRPFIEIDGTLRTNDYASLTRECPYVVPGTWADRSSVDYNGRLGIRGGIWRDRLTYRLYAACTIGDHRNYWYTTGIANTLGSELQAVSGALQLQQAQQIELSFHGEAEFRPLSALLFELGLHGYLFSDDIELATGRPAFEANLGVRYSVQRFTFGASLAGQTGRKWTLLYSDAWGSAERGFFTAHAVLNLGISVDWRATGRLTVFAEGDNLLNQNIYRYAGYREYGANVTAGIKYAF